MDQGGQECGEMDAPVVPRIRRQQGPTPSLRPGLQPWELPSTAGPAARDQALDPDNDSGEIDQDWGKDRSPCLVRPRYVAGECAETLSAASSRTDPDVLFPPV